MPELRPFRAIRYSAASQLADLVCPPYDVISPAEQRLLHNRHPHNAVRVELPFSEAPHEDAETRYRRAGEQFEAWLRAGVLTRERDAALFVYRQDRRTEGGAHRRVAGVIGALRLEPLDASSGILAHERTMPAPIQDRLALLRACPVNLSPIYAIYRGRGGLAPYLDGLVARPTIARFVDDHATLHRLWAVTAPAEIEMLAAAVRPGPLVIADGHHRYETALAYRAERGDAPGHHDAVMCLCVDADVEDVQVLSYNRVFRAASNGGIGDRLLARFPGRRLEPGDRRAELNDSQAAHPLWFVLPREDVLIEVPESEVRRRVGGRSAAWAGLDVVVLHEVVFPQLWPEGVELTFSSDADRVVELVRRQGWAGGVVLRDLGAHLVIAVAVAGERMPQKASYFTPKAVTGLVFRSLV